MLSPKSTINCLFVKKNYSFQGTVGLLFYQGPIFNLALMFSVPFNYATHKTEFALAIIIEPISRDPERILDNIIQGIESPELKGQRVVFRCPTGP